MDKQVNPRVIAELQRIADTVPQWENEDGWSAWVEDGCNASGNPSKVLWLKFVQAGRIELRCLLPFGISG